MPKGNLIACADEKNQLWSIDPEKNVTVLLKDYKGKLLNGPNDVWVRPDGGLYFTDPFYKREYWKRGPMEQEAHSVYFLSADRDKFTRVVDDLKNNPMELSAPQMEKRFTWRISPDEKPMPTISNPMAHSPTSACFVS